MTKKELLDLLKEYNDDTRICLYNKATGQIEEPVVTAVKHWEGNERNILKLDYITIS